MGRGYGACPPQGGADLVIDAGDGRWGAGEKWEAAGVVSGPPGTSRPRGVGDEDQGGRGSAGRAKRGDGGLQG